MVLALSLMTTAAAAQTDCLAAGAGACTAAADAAVALQDGLPQDLGRVRLMFAIAGGRSVVVGALAPADGTAPEAMPARDYLCHHAASRSYLDGGGRIEVLVGGTTLLDLTTCEAP